MLQTSKAAHIPTLKWASMGLQMMRGKTREIQKTPKKNKPKRNQMRLPRAMMLKTLRRWRKKYQNGVENGILTRTNQFLSS